MLCNIYFLLSRFRWWIKKIEIFWNNVKVFKVTFDQFNASLLNKKYYFYFIIIIFLKSFWLQIFEW